MSHDARLSALRRAVVCALAVAAVEGCGPNRVFPIRALDASLIDPPPKDAAVDVVDVPMDMAMDTVVPPPDAPKSDAFPLDALQDVPPINPCPAVVNTPIGFATLGTAPTTGGAGGAQVTVTSAAELMAAAAQIGKLIITVSGTINLTTFVPVTSDKTIQGTRGAGDQLIGGGLDLKGSQNIVIRYLTISKVLAVKAADAIGLNLTKNVWIDHCDLSSTLDAVEGTYDGLVDISHASDWVTISWTVFHDHRLVSLVSHSADNSAEDTGHLTVTYHHNVFRTTVLYTPKVRFGSVHVFNNVYEGDGIHRGTAIVSQQNAQVLIEANVFKNIPIPISTAPSALDANPVGGTVWIPNPDTNVYQNSGPNVDLAIKPWVGPFPYVYKADTAEYAEAVSGCAGPYH